MEIQGYLLIDSARLKNITTDSFIDKLSAKKFELETFIKDADKNIKALKDNIEEQEKIVTNLESKQATNIIIKKGYYKLSNKYDYEAFKDAIQNNKFNNSLFRYNDYSITWQGSASAFDVYWAGVDDAKTISLTDGELAQNMNAIIAANELKSKLTTRKLILVAEKPQKEAQLKSIDEILNKNSSVTIKLDKHKMFVEGKKITDEEYLISLTGRCLVRDVVPQVTDDIEKPLPYDRYNIINRVIRMKLDNNLNILSHDAFELIAYEVDELIPIPADTFAGTSIVNILEANDYKYEEVKSVIDSGLKEIERVKLPELDWENMFKRGGGNYADIYLKPDFSKITDGRIETETITQSTGISESKQVWKGNYPLDRLIYTIQSNLDILMANRKINGDAYGNLYATLLVQAIQSSTVLEQARLQAYEQASQFQIKSMIEYYLGAITAKLNVVKTLAEVSTAFLQKSILQAQIKLYNIQTNGFKANNINKLFTAQFDGASTAYTSGMLDTPPSILNNSDLMSLYTNVGSDMSVL